MAGAYDADRLTGIDTAYLHVNPYGLFTLDMTTRLAITDVRVAA